MHKNGSTLETRTAGMCGAVLGSMNAATRSRHVVQSEYSVVKKSDFYNIIL